jgi:hypothetical protein
MPLKAYGGVKVQIHTFLTLAVREISGTEGWVGFRAGLTPDRNRTTISMSQSGP